MYVRPKLTFFSFFFCFFYAPFPKTKILILLVDLFYFAHTFAVFCSYFCWRSARIKKKRNELVCKIGHTDKVHNKGCYRGCAEGRPAEYVVEACNCRLISYHDLPSSLVPHSPCFRPPPVLPYNKFFFGNKAVKQAYG